MCCGGVTGPDNSGCINFRQICISSANDDFKCMGGGRRQPSSSPSTHPLTPGSFPRTDLSMAAGFLQLGFFFLKKKKKKRWLTEHLDDCFSRAYLHIVWHRILSASTSQPTTQPDLTHLTRSAPPLTPRLAAIAKGFQLKKKPTHFPRSFSFSFSFSFSLFLFFPLFFFPRSVASLHSLAVSSSKTPPDPRNPATLTPSSPSLNQQQLTTLALQPPPPPPPPLLLTATNSRPLLLYIGRKSYP